MVQRQTVTLVLFIIYTADLGPIVADHARSHYYVVWQHTIRYDTIKGFNVDKRGYTIFELFFKSIKSNIF